MKSKNEIIKSSAYWLAHLQVELFNQLKNYMEKNQLSQNDLVEEFKVSKGHISQILNGDSNFTLKKLIDLSLKIGKVPVIKFVDYNNYLSHEKEINKILVEPQTSFKKTEENVIQSRKKADTVSNIPELSFKPRPKRRVSKKPQILNTNKNQIN